MVFFRRLLRRRRDRDAALPTGPSLFAFIQAKVEDGRLGPDGRSCELPDETNRASGSFRWAAGAPDGVALHHMAMSPSREGNAFARTTVRRVMAYTRKPTASRRDAVYRQVATGSVVGEIDRILERLVDTAPRRQERLYELARFLAVEGAHREAVKLGVALLGRFGRPEDRAIFEILGRHDEFTLYCAVALENASDDPDDALWSLARNVRGWGRIHVVERLERTERADIRDWLLREGFRNSVMHEYLAAICARAGGLRAALAQPSVDRELLTAAGDILHALVQGGPAECIDDYEDAPWTVTSYVGHIEAHAEALGDFLSVARIRDYLAHDDGEWAERYRKGWAADARDELRRRCDAILARPSWHDAVAVGLNSDDEIEFLDASAVARRLGLDPWEHHWRRLQREPGRAGHWYHVTVGCDESRMARIVALAEASLDLTAIASGADVSLGLGPEFEPHCCLDYVLQGLRDFPGHGARLIAAGLQSPVTRNRNMALAALTAWPRETWPGAMVETLERAERVEPNREVRTRIRAQLARR